MNVEFSIIMLIHSQLWTIVIQYRDEWHKKQTGTKQRNQTNRLIVFDGIKQFIHFYYSLLIY